MPRFVVLQHVPGPEGRPEGRGQRHWDFMLETQGMLRTWAIAEPPAAGRSLEAEALPDHRLAYLDYEGPISGERGDVTRWDRGTYRLVREDESECVVILAGQRLTGQATLRREPGETQRWRLELSGD